MDLSKRNHIFSLKALPGAHALLIVSAKSNFWQMLNKRNEQVLGVILFEEELVRAGEWFLFYIQELGIGFVVVWVVEEGLYQVGIHQWT